MVNAVKLEPPRKGGRLTRFSVKRKYQDSPLLSFWVEQVELATAANVVAVNMFKEFINGSRGNN